MDLIDRLNNIATRIANNKNQVQTEEATKNALIMPFISALGYDVFNPLEVVPEFTADVGIKKGEKVDYCIMNAEKPALIIECKHWNENLDKHGSQLHRYFHVVAARFGILTNGVEYRFYTDLEEPNKMDSKPFFEFSMEAPSEAIVHELKKFQKDKFNVDDILNTASDLKYSKLVKTILKAEFINPSEDFVKIITKQVYSGRVTATVLEQFTEIIKKSLKEYIGDSISNLIKRAEVISSENLEKEESSDNTELLDNNGIFTSEEELQGYRVIQAILVPLIDVKRIVHRDTKSYFGVLLDDNNRKPICRLYLDKTKKYLEVFDENKKGIKYPIESVNDIYTHRDALITSLTNYLKEDIEKEL